MAKLSFADEKPGFMCYDLTSEERSLRSENYAEREICEREPGRVFTAGYTHNYPDCESCWCCKGDLLNH